MSEKMEKVSARVFFTVMWRGVCQALGWFFGLFGYKRDGKFAKCVWGLFATSGAIVMALLAWAMLSCAGESVYNRYFRSHQCDGEYCYYASCIKRDIYFHDADDSDGYVYNRRTGEKLIKHVAWIAEPATETDTLVCFSDGKKRGYFSSNTGKVVIEPKYDHAWIFSEGMASVDEGGFIKFIDGTGKVVIDKHQAYNPDVEGMVFHGGYCVVPADGEKRCGLMDKTGNLVLPMEYRSIDPTSDFKLWTVQKNEQMAVLDQKMKTVIPFMECSVYINDGTIDLSMKADHTMRKYDLTGKLLNDFCISSVRMLEYEKDEILYRTVTHDDDGETYAEPCVESYHPKAVARLRAYVAADGYEGLMTADGHVVVMPLYMDIEALGYDSYLCSLTNGDKVIVNGKGEIVR